jgi:hypothetical protein
MNAGTDQDRSSPLMTAELVKGWEGLRDLVRSRVRSAPN